MKITLLLIVAWLAAVSAHSSLRHHESSLERLEDFKGRVLNKSDDTEDTAPSNDNNERDNGDDGEDDTKKSRDNADDEEDDEDDDDDEDSTTRAHRHGHQRGGDRRFCEFIDIVDDGQDCLDEVIDAVNDLFEGTEVGLYENCNDADDDEVTCLEISDSNDCEEVVNDALNELDEFCISDRGGFDFGDGDRDGIIRLTNHCDKITLFDDGHECLEDVARAIEDEFDDDTLVSLDNRCHGNLCLMMPEDEDDCGDLSDAFVRYTHGINVAVKFEADTTIMTGTTPTQSGFILLGMVMDTMVTNAMVTNATPKTQTILAIPGICDIKELTPPLGTRSNYVATQCWQIVLENRV